MPKKRVNILQVFVHIMKQAMKQEQFNSKKSQVFSNCSSNYCKQTMALQKTNNIQAEMNHVNMEIMSKDQWDLPEKLVEILL